MKALCVIYGGRLAEPASDEVLPGKKSAFSLALEAASRFPRVEKTVLFGLEGKEYPGNIETVLKSSWTVSSLLNELSISCADYDFIYYFWADCPLMDSELAGSMADRHIRYAAEYTYADGWPYGFAPELLSKQTIGILAKISEKDDSQVERDAIFKVIQKDINAFDIETEISSVDLRHYRLTLAADSKRNLLLVKNLMEAGLKSVKDAEKILIENPGLLRTLPCFFSIQILDSCPQSCSFCPLPKYGSNGEKRFIAAEDFSNLLDKIIAFAGDAVIDLSLWGEPALHPEKIKLIEMVLERPELSLIVETSGIGWNNEDLKGLSQYPAAPRHNYMAPLSWIVSLDAHDPDRYKEIRGPGFAEARTCAKTLMDLFPGNTYVQALRVKGSEDDIEHFFRYWKEEAGGSTNHIIIQKYNDFCGALPKLQASDLSPLKRRPCWHIIRDMVILIDGNVPVCREDLGALKGNADRGILGNIFTEDPGLIWERGASLYMKHCNAIHEGICSNCDEYYTYNF